MRILIQFATRSRPEKFKSALLALINNLGDKIHYRINVVIDEDDGTMNDTSFYSWIYGQGNTIISLGKSKNKIDAVNRSISDIDFLWNICLVCSDDMMCEAKGFDNIIRRDMAANFPDFDGVLHYNDGMQKSNVMTYSIYGRKYFDRFNYLYHPDYESVWADVEATEVAWVLGKYKYMGNDVVLFKHLHPVWKLAEWDEQYKKNEAPEVYARDKEVFLRRRAMNYGLKKEEIVNGFKYANV